MPATQTVLHSALLPVAVATTCDALWRDGTRHSTGAWPRQHAKQLHGEAPPVQHMSGGASGVAQGAQQQSLRGAAGLAKVRWGSGVRLIATAAPQSFVPRPNRQFMNPPPPARRRPPLRPPPLPLPPPPPLAPPPLPPLLLLLTAAQLGAADTGAAAKRSGCRLPKKGTRPGRAPRPPAACSAGGCASSTPIAGPGE